MNTILHKNTAQLLDLLQLLSSISDNEYSKPLKELQNSTVGKHVRHILEFYTQLLTDKEVVSYDSRIRNTQIENEIATASETLISIVDKLSHIQDDKTISLDCSITLGKKQILQTTLFRELLYTLDHTLHHLAIIKIGLEFSLHIKIAEHIGLAPSTIHFNKSVCAQ